MQRFREFSIPSVPLLRFFYSALQIPNYGSVINRKRIPRSAIQSRTYTEICIYTNTPSSDFAKPARLFVSSLPLGKWNGVMHLFAHHCNCTRIFLNLKIINADKGKAKAH